MSETQAINCGGCVSDESASEEGDDGAMSLGHAVQ